ncbi:uncharacterized protein LOC143284715 [Babylonia areolata]|uniref:uncharacterized protein LOC143284715 n=1 Tax=Babylonia areolata TaxID=304850 RepID=UPI003FD2802F
MHVLHPGGNLVPRSGSPHCGCSCRHQFSASTSQAATAAGAGAGAEARHQQLLSVSEETHFRGGRLGSVNGPCACAAGIMCSDSGGGGGRMAAAGARETASHLFEEADRLGKGGTCDVYCGVEKGTGRRHALKVLRDPSPVLSSQLVQEARTLGRLSCPNIVRMYDLTFEVGSGRPVMVMERCNGGSLHAFLQQPENACGLDDTDFLTLLRSLVDALSYLRATGLVHRDIKPGNILRHVHENGKCEFKLSDFGTSREATDTEQMTSIVGTEEYLHPVLYKSAFFGHKSHSAINPTSGELWSLGCTLYHAMTASVPFRPLGGARNNRKAMFVMISQKPPGSISGDQRMDGTFRWGSAPPSDCRMSESLRQKVTPLLQNLLETDSSRQWSFATFLDESQRVLGMRCFHVCDTEIGELFRLYMDPRQSVAELQDSLAFHSEVPAGDQLLFHRLHPLLTALDSRAQARHLPPTLEGEQPYLLLSPQRATEARCRRQGQVQPQLLAADGTLEEDVTLSFKACSDLYTHLLAALTFRRLPNLLFSAILALRIMLTSCQSTVEARFRVLSATCQERQSRMALISQVLGAFQPPPPSSSSSSSTSSSSSSGQHGGSSSNNSSSNNSSSKLSEARALCDQLRDKLWQLKYRLDEFRREGADKAKHDTALSDFLDGDDSCGALKRVFGRAKEVWQEIQERRQKVPLSPLEQDKQKGDRETFNLLCTESYKRMKKLQANKAKLLDQYRNQARQLYERVEVAQNMDAQLQKLREESDRFSALLDEIWSTEWEQVRKVTEHVRLGDALKTSSATVPLQNQLGELIAEGLPVLETFHLSPPGARQK